jgi:hypothetical protein
VVDERQCGSCTLCCKVMTIQELAKPAGQWCPHCAIGKGCGIYEDRPESCRLFKCVWLVDPTMPDELKPEKSKVVVFVPIGGRRMVALCDPTSPLAWMKEPFYSGLKQMARKAASEGKSVMAFAGERHWVVGPVDDIDLGEVDPNVTVKVGYQPNGRLNVEKLPSKQGLFGVTEV